MASSRNCKSRSRRINAAALMIGCGLAMAVGPIAHGQIQWRTDPQVNAVSMSGAEIGQTLAGFAATGEVRHGVVELSRITSLEERDYLRSLGIDLLRSLGGTGYLVAVQPSVNAQRAARSGLISQIGALDLRRKMHPDLNAGLTHEWMIVESAAEIRARGLESGLAVDEADKAAASPLVAVYVMMHADVDPLDGGFDAVVRHGGEVVSLVDSINALVVHISRDSVSELAGEDVVAWVEPPLPKFSTTNASARAIMGVETVNAAPYGLDGSGVSVMVYDAGRVFNHTDFGGRATAGDTDGISEHATHVAGTVGGDGSISGGTHRGMAPGVEIISYGFEVVGGLQPGFLYTDPGDFEADYDQAMNTHGATIANNSIGSNVESNGYTCSWQGDYGLMASLIDEVVVGSLGSPYRIVWAAGNERQGSRCDVEGYGDYYSTAPPGNAKNQIAVGAINSNDDSMTWFSSWGPTDDGRLKPDITGPGCQTTDDMGVTSTSISNGYITFCGTSMASPAVAGVSALIIEQWRILHPGMPDMRNATLKTILANSAVDLGNPGPDYQFGYGSVRAQPAVDTVLEGRVLEATISQGQTQFYIAVVEPGDSELKVTLSWDDPAATPMTTSALINDVDLRIIGPDGTEYLPWTLDPSNPSASAVQSVVDRLNNTEQVAISNPTPGAYRVEIEGFNIAQGPAQEIGVSSSTQLFTCSSAGIVGISGSRQACSATISIDVVDCDLNLDDGVIDTATVLLTSTSEPAGEVVVVSEVGAAVSVFSGMIDISETDAPGVLQVVEGDLIEVTYIDVDDGSGGTNVPVVASATVDCTPPLLVATSTPIVEARDVVIDVTVTEDASVTIRYGTSCGALTSSVTSSQMTTDHSIGIGGLLDDVTYFYTVEMTDIAGNSSLDNNGGSCYSFTTLGVPDFMTEQFTAGSDLVGSMVTFTPDGGPEDFYRSCAESLGGSLPTDPSGGTTLFLGDDSSTSVSVGNGNSVLLYGTAWTSFFVGSNGYITFGFGDSDFSENLGDHFSQPRISMWFDDLNPGAGGTISYKRLGDRIAVTYQGLPEFPSDGSNTFQVEMFYDGTIRLSWLSMTSPDGIVGLSDGSGLSPDFQATNLSSAAGCFVCIPDFTGDGTLDFFDVQAFLDAFAAQDPAADINGDTLFDFFDIQIYLSLFSAGCP